MEMEKFKYAKVQLRVGVDRAGVGQAGPVLKETISSN